MAQQVRQVPFHQKFQMDPFDQQVHVSHPVLEVRAILLLLEILKVLFRPLVHQVQMVQLALEALVTHLLLVLHWSLLDPENQQALLALFHLGFLLVQPAQQDLVVLAAQVDQEVRIHLAHLAVQIVLVHLEIRQVQLVLVGHLLLVLQVVRQGL